MKSIEFIFLSVLHKQNILWVLTIVSLVRLIYFDCIVGNYTKRIRMENLIFRQRKRLFSSFTSTHQVVT